MKTYLLLPMLCLTVLMSVSLMQPVHADVDQVVTQESIPVLYYDPMCSHCQRVLNYLEGIDVKVLKKNIRNYSYRQELISMGANTVPVLVVGSQKIIGAQAILNYFKNQYD